MDPDSEAIGNSEGEVVSDGVLSPFEGDDEAQMLPVPVPNRLKEDLSNEEDVDVDILYMRLQALQSMKEKLDQETEDSEIVDEMQELLEEADQAAIEELVPENHSDENMETNQAVVMDDIDEAGMDIFMKASIEESEELSTNPDPMSNVVKRLKEAARKQQQELDLHYSPTQSPIRDDLGLQEFDINQVQSPPEPEPEPEDEDTELQPRGCTASCQTEAEQAFFKQQLEEPLFPASVWEFQKKPTCIDINVTNEHSSTANSSAGDPNATLEAYHSAVMADSKSQQKFRRKRARSRGKSQSVSEASETVIDKKVTEDEDENALRAAVLTSIAMKRAKKVEIEAEEKTKSSQEKLTPAPVVQVKKANVKKTVKKISPKKSKALTLAEKKKILEKRKIEVLKKAKINKDREKLRLEIEKLNKKDGKPIKNKSKVLPLIKKHFPNMFMHRVIIPAEDLKEGPSNNVPTTSNSSAFLLKLDTLMKDLRGVQAKKPGKKLAPPKPIRKFPPRTKSSSLSKADKEELKTSTISHLPLDKQKEYKKLLLLVKQKENLNLLAKSKQAKNAIKPVVKESQSKEKPAPQKVPVEKPTEESLQAKEAELIKVRKEMCASLFKLSAEVSQLKVENEKMETAVAFLQKLKDQVTITENIIAVKHQRIDKLKTVVRESLDNIQVRNRGMADLKKGCKAMGVSLQGPKYEPPKDGMETIKRKLSVINSSAKKVATTTTQQVPIKKPSKESPSGSESASSSSSSSDSDSSSSEDEQGGQQENNSLAHLSQSSSVVLDPQIELCRFDLQGRCNDDACPYQHLKR